MKYKFLKHTADIKFQAFGKTLEKSFENSALAMSNSMYEQKVKSKLKKKINVSGKNLESLLYNFLEELLFLLDSKGFFVSKIKVKINKNKDEKKNQTELSADVFGDNAKNYKIGLDVKAVTYNEMFVKKINGLWVCQVVIDV